MAIAPVMNTGLRVNNYNTNFTGRRNDNNGYVTDVPSVSANKGALKAIPLAALLAMSPLNPIEINASDRIDEGHRIEMVDNSFNAEEVSELSAQQQTKKVVASKIFKTKDENYSGIEVRLVNRSGGAGFDGVEIGYINRGMNKPYRYSKVASLNKINFSVISDDGKNQGQIPMTKIVYEAGIGSAREEQNDEISKYIEDALAVNSKKNVIPINVYNKRIGMDDIGKFQRKVNGNKFPNAQGFVLDKSEFTKNTLNRTVKGDDGTYNLSCYKRAQNGKSIMLLEKQGYPGKKFLITAVCYNKAMFNDLEDSPAGVSYYSILLKGKNNVDSDKIALMDTKLAKELLNMYNDYAVTYGNETNYFMPFELNSRYGAEKEGLLFIIND